MHTVTIRLTTPLRRFVGGRRDVAVDAGSVGEALGQLGERYPDLRGRVVNADGSLREFIQVHVGRNPLQRLGGLSATLNGGEVISLSSPFSGG